MTRTSPHARPVVAAMLALVLAAWPGGTARAQAPPAAAPGAFLEVGSGRAHVGGVALIEVSDDGSVVATKGADETLKIWNAATGKLLQVLRPNRVGGVVRSFDAMAFVPGTRQLLVSVFGGTDAETRAPLSQLVVHDVDARSTQPWASRAEGRFSALAFAADGKLLYACHSTKAMVAFDRATRRIAFEDARPATNCARAGASREGKVAALFGNTLRLYDARLALLAEATVPAKTASALKFSHDGRRIAIGDMAGSTAYVFDAADLARRQALASAEIVGNTLRVAWSRDDRSLFVAGSTARRGGKRVLVRYALDGGGHDTLDPDELSAAGRPSESRAPNEETFALTSASDGALYAGMSPGRIYKLDPGGTVRVFAEGANAPMAFAGTAPLLVSPAGTSLAHQFRGERAEAFRFDLERSELAVGAVGHDGLEPPRAASASLRIRVAPERDAFTVGDSTTRIGSSQRYRSHALSHDDKVAVIVAGIHLYCVDAAGKVLWQRRAPFLPFQAVNIPRGSDVAVVATANSIVWYRLSDGQVRASLLVDNTRKRWVAWTPNGHYEASVGGEYLLGWIVNGSIVGRYYPIANYRATLARGELVAAAIREPAAPLARPSFPAATAVAAATQRPAAGASAAAEGGAPSLEASLQRSAPPQVTVLNPGDGDSFATDTIRAVVAVETPPEAPVRSIRARVNGALVAQGGDRGAAARVAGSVHTLLVPMPRDDAEIVFVAENANGIGSSAPVAVRFAGPKDKPVTPADAPRQKALYLLAVGISDYRRPELRLGFAAKDARDFVAALATQKGKLYRDVQVKALVDQEATRANIQDGLDWIMKQVTKDDVAMVFFAGHGENDASGSYYFIPVDGDPERLRATAVPWGDIKDTAFNLPGKRLFFLDTCHAGNALGSARRSAANTNKLLNELAAAEDGAVVFMSSTGRQYSLEDPAWGNGAFTRALVDGIKGAADPDKRGWVTHKMLDSYVAERVKTLTGGKQTPVSAAQGVPDFPIIQF